MNDTEAPQSTVPSDGSEGPSDLTAEDVARRAYERFLERGQEHGHDLDDWLTAEQELRGRSTPEPISAPEASAAKKRLRRRTKGSAANVADPIVPGADATV